MEWETKTVKGKNKIPNNLSGMETWNESQRIKFNSDEGKVSDLGTNIKYEIFI